MTADDLRPRALASLFARTAAEGRAALIGYLPAGFPTVPDAVTAMRAMVEGGVDAIEVGLPYSDPLLDGPTIQAAVDLALRQGVTTSQVMDTVRQLSVTGAPTMVMSYWNPIERYGVERFSRDLADAGGAGVITADITPDSSSEWRSASEAAGIDRIFLVAPSSTQARIALTAEASSGFVYAAAVMGVTGARTQVGSAAEDLVRRTKAVTSLPVCVGLGVSTGEQAAEIGRYADGVIVGSAFVRAMLDAESVSAGVEQVRRLAEELRAGVERAAAERSGPAVAGSGDAL